MYFRFFSLLLGIGLTLGATTAARVSADEALPVAEVQQDEPVHFEKQILPLLRRNCIACHNTTDAESDLILETPQAILKGGLEGPGVVPGNADASLVFRLAAHRQESFMPPEDNAVGAKQLTPQELGLIKLWIDQGAQGEITSGQAAVWQPRPAGANPIYAVAITPHGRFVAASRGNQIYVYSVPSHQELGRLTDPELLKDGLYDTPGVAHRDAVQSLAFSPDGRQLASGGFRTVKIWHRDDGFRHAKWPAAEADVRVLAVSDGGQRAAVAQTNGKITVYDVISGQQIRSLTGPPAGAISLAWSSDASRLVVAALDGTAVIWSLADGQQVGQLSSTGPVNAVAMVNAGQQIVTGGDDAIIRVWDVPAANDSAPEAGGAAAEAAKPIREIPGHSGPITALARVPNHPHGFVSASRDGTARQWDANDGKQIRLFAHRAPVCAVAVASDGKRIATAAETGTTKLWNAEDGKQVADLTSNSQSLNVLADLQRAVELARRHVENANIDLEAAVKRQQAETANAEKAVAELAAAELAAKQSTEAVAKQMADKEAAEKELAELQSQHTAATAADPQSEKELTALAENTKAAEKKAADLAATAQIAIADERAATEAAQAAERTVHTAQRAVERTAAEVSSFKGLLDKRVQEQKAAEERAAEKQQDIDSLRVPADEVRGPVRAVAFSPDGTQVAVASDAGRVDFFSSQSGVPLHQLHSPAGEDAPAGRFVAAAYVSSDRLLTAAEDRSLAVWASLPQWSLQRKLGSVDSSSPFVNRVTALDFSPAGDLLATGGGAPSRSGELHLWNAETGELVRQIPDAFSDTVFGIAFSEDGKYLATCGADRFMKVFQTATGKHIRSFEGHTHHVLGVSWRADGRLLATSGADNVAKVWDFNTGEAIRSITGFKKELTAIEFLGVSDSFVITTGDKRVLTRNTDGAAGPNFPGVTDFMYTVCATRDGKLVVAGGQDGVLHVWNQQGESIVTFPPSQ